MSANLKVTLLIITGTMGSGKTTILAEASDILKRLDVSHAAIDLDALALHAFRTALALMLPCMKICAWWLKTIATSASTDSCSRVQLRLVQIWTAVVRLLGQTKPPCAA
jgi:predicted ABC-type ATPase